MIYLLFVIFGLTSAAPRVILEVNDLPEYPNRDDSFELSIEHEKLEKTDDYALEETPMCPKDWIYAKELKNCYFILHNVDFDLAKSGCEIWKSSLLSIHSKAENDFIFDLLHSNETHYSDMNALILGAKRVNETFAWLDGTPFDYSIWAGSEPNNWKPPTYGDALPRSENEDCVAMYTEEISWGNELTPPKPYLGRWNDNICSGIYSYTVCKKAAIL
ncbi:unnamed protein product, partial [Mesorhabditis belari]|uniref:C-type lectin domain-containing protein n=1 Tax=Mesorhabditis belari TaxID=2138241 RepID=A0AAF3F5I2_9BILA